MTDFPMQDSKSTFKQFFIRTFFYFLVFNIVYQLLARHLSKQIETMKNYSDRFKPFLLKSDHALHVRFSSGVYCEKIKVNPGQKTCMQKKNGGHWLHTMHYSNIPVFLASTKKIN